MVNSRAPGVSTSQNTSSSSETQLNTAYSLALLSEYTHTLDSLPLDLSRNIGDLRELDAVLSSSMINITAKIHSLTCMIEEGRGTKEERLWLLHEIAEEAARLKYGGDDKIRVACNAADSLKAHSAHLYTLGENIPNFDVALLRRKTIYPHVSDKSFMPLNMDTGRRRRGGAGSHGLLSTANTADPSPAKRKRIARDDDIDIGGVRSPHKRERLQESTNPRSRLGRVKKAERPPSPSESVLSVTSHLPVQASHNTNGTSRTTSAHPNHLLPSSSTARNPNATSNVNKRRGGPTASTNNPSNNSNNNNNNNNNNNRVSSTPLTNDYPPHNAPSHRPLPSTSTSSHHPPGSSTLAPYPNGAGSNTALANGGGYYNGTGDHPHSVSGTPDLGMTPNGLAGPGVPFARSASVHSNVTNTNGPTGGGGGRNGNAGSGGSGVNGTGAADEGVVEGGDPDGDGDDGKTYCFCDGVSYGEMIACDDETCEREWFHLACIGLTVCPEGSWFCDTCKNKRNNKRPGRGGKRRAAGSRAAGKA